MLDQRRRNIRVALDRRFHEVSTIILSRQNPATGLIPASVAVTTHGDYTHAWTRDNVYSILAVWGLALAYRRIDDDEGRTCKCWLDRVFFLTDLQTPTRTTLLSVRSTDELENATIKCMRGLLFAMMRQAHKVELFKNTQALEHSLHAKYNTANGDVVVGDREWGHLQIDATSIFLLALAQMTASGLLIIYTKDEVDFIQNLVFYIERAYRTPDYGIWERGNKLNHGQPELNSSSIGMAVAALQAINGLNLFGARGGPSSVIHVLPDELTRNYTTLHSALPRESYSKEIDAALLSVISFPGFAVSDPKLIAKTRSEMVKKLGGKYGFKRFLRDGHQTVLEDTSRLHYDSHELKIFEHIECEWPLFFTYMILDGLFRDDPNQVEEYSQLLEPLLVDSGTLSRFSVAEDYDHTQKLHKDNNRRRSSSRRRSIAAPSSPRPNRIALVPELYIVPRDYTNQEKADPGSVQRYPNENIPLVWAQSLYILGSLIKEDLLSPAELDPLGRRFLPNRPKQASEVVVQMVLLAESAQLRDQLAAYGLETQTVDMCAPITVSTASALRDAYLSLGKNAKLGLSGRPKRPMGTLSTSKIYRCQGQLYAFLPHFTNKEEFYLVSDYNYLISIFEQELTFVKNHWWYTGRPTMVVMLTKEMFGEARGSKEITGPSRWRFNNGSNSKRNLLNFLMSLRTGTCAGVKVRVGKLADMIGLASIESLDFLISTKNMDEAEEWRQTLKGDVGPHDHERLHYSQRPQRGRSARRKSSADGSHRKSRSPLKSPYYTEDPTKYEQFKLRDHVDDDDMAALDLGPPVATPAVGAAAGAVPLSPVDAAAAAAAAIPPATPLRFIESRPGTPTLRTASPRRGSSSKMRATLTETSMNPDAVGGGAALSRRNSYVFDVNDGSS
ncbi:glycosyl hydrolases family 15-domain-containing protein [Zopfochytrium polystomum]|nr:glycosyl hydrolases family 15-domain-containing protein [Zopfochytrium polystomum]